MGLILVISLIMKYLTLVSKGHLVYNLNFSSQFSLELIKKKRLFGIYEIICLLYIKLCSRIELSILIVLLRVVECSSMRFINF